MSHDENNFCKNYLFLNAEAASCFDCVRVLRSLEKREFFITGVEEERVVEFRHRWIIFISLVAQKLFLLSKKPLAALGSAVELCLNFPAFNGGFRGLFFNSLTGRLVKPDRNSETFKSLLGFVDKRFDLKCKYRNKEASIAIMASKLSYENEPFARNVVTHKWEMEFLGLFNFWNDFQELYTISAMVFRDKNRIVIAFRGTEPFDADAWRTDVDLSWYELPGIGKIHGGFMKALGLQKTTGWPKHISSSKPFAYYYLREMLKTLIQENGGAKFIVTGHSLGAALAILFVSILTVHEEEFLLTRLEGVYTFGQPRVGNEQFGEYMKQKIKKYDIKYFRYVYCNDLVTRLPYDEKAFLYKHFGPCLYFNGCYKGQVLEEEPNKNYFSLLYVLPKYLNAGYEMIRGFILPQMKGEEFKEGWLMGIFRIIALIIPGLIDHFPLEYDNATRFQKRELTYVFSD